MKKMVAVLMMGGCLALMAAGGAWAGEHVGRQTQQCRRINQGLHSGALTRGEARVLFREQRHIRNATERAWADGRLTRHERRRLHKMQRRAGRHIYGLKHNRWHR
jgi:hypothetical protein